MVVSECDIEAILGLRKADLAGSDVSGELFFAGRRETQQTGSRDGVIFMLLSLFCRQFNGNIQTAAIF